MGVAMQAHQQAGIMINKQSKMWTSSTPFPIGRGSIAEQDRTRAAAYDTAITNITAIPEVLAINNDSEEAAAPKKQRREEQPPMQDEVHTSMWWTKGWEQDLPDHQPENLF